VDIAISGGRIAGLGSGYQAKERIDAGGAFIARVSSMLNVHIESSLCTPGAVRRRGRSARGDDGGDGPHEIANVAGAEVSAFMAAKCQGTPLNLIIWRRAACPRPTWRAGAASSRWMIDEAREQGLHMDWRK